MPQGRPLHPPSPLPEVSTPRPPLDDTAARLRAAIRAACHDLLASRSPLADAADLVSGTQRQRHDAAALRAELRAAVGAHVQSLRTGGLPAERVVVMVKGIVRESTPEGLDVGEARELMEDVVRWSIEVFYAT